MAASTAYTYRVKAYDNAGNESTLSAQARATTLAGGNGVLNFYISPTGNNNNPGTQSQPWAITALNTKRSTYAGNIVWLMDGTYNISSLPTTSNGVRLWIPSGTSSSPTIIRAVNPRQAIVTGKNGIVDHCELYNSHNLVYQKNKDVTPPPDGMVIFLAGVNGISFPLRPQSWLPKSNRVNCPWRSQTLEPSGGHSFKPHCLFFIFFNGSISCQQCIKWKPDESDRSSFVGVI